MIPSAARALNASRTTVRDTPNSTARPASDGTGSPTRRRSARMRWLIARMALSTSPPSASALDRARDRFIHPDHYDSCARFVCNQPLRRLSILIFRRIGGLLGKGAGGRQEVGVRRDGAKTGLRRSRYRRRERRLRTNGAMHSSGSISAAKRIHRLRLAERRHEAWPAPDFPTSIGLRTDGGAIVAMLDRVALWDYGGEFPHFGDH